MRHDQHLTAIRQLWASTGKRPEQLVSALTQEWGLSVFEAAHLRHTAARLGPLPDKTPPSPEAIEAHETQQRLRETNPFRAAHHQLRHAEAIEQGADYDDDPPPEAA